MGDKRQDRDETDRPRTAAPGDRDAARRRAAQYLDMWEQHLSLSATAGLKPPEPER